MHGESCFLENNSLACRVGEGDEQGSGKIQRALEGTLLIVDLLLELKNGVGERLRDARGQPGRRRRGDDLIAALHDGVIIEDAAGSGAAPMR